MDDECKEVTGKPIYLKQLCLKMLQGSVSSQRLVSSVKTDKEARDLIELLFNELESICWKEFHRNQQLRQSKREKEKKLSEKTKQTQDFIQEIAVSEDQLLREIEIIQSKKVGQQTCDHSMMSEHEEETNQLLIAEDRSVISILNTTKPTRTLSNKTFSLKNLDKMVNETECTLTTTKEISQELKRKELCQSLRLTTLQSKLDNLTRLEEIYAIQFQKLKNEMDKANFYLSRKKRNLQVIKEHIHEVQSSIIMLQARIAQKNTLVFPDYDLQIKHANEDLNQKREEINLDSKDTFALENLNKRLKTIRLMPEPGRTHARIKAMSVFYKARKELAKKKLEKLLAGLKLMDTVSTLQSIETDAGRLSRLKDLLG